MTIDLGARRCGSSSGSTKRSGCPPTWPRPCGVPSTGIDGAAVRSIPRSVRSACSGDRLVEMAFRRLGRVSSSPTTWSASRKSSSIRKPARCVVERRDFGSTSAGSERAWRPTRRSRCSGLEDWFVPSSTSAAISSRAFRRPDRPDGECGFGPSRATRTKWCCWRTVRSRPVVTSSSFSKWSGRGEIVRLSHLLDPADGHGRWRHDGGR